LSTANVKEVIPTTKPPHPQVLLALRHSPRLIMIAAKNKNKNAASSSRHQHHAVVSSSKKRPRHDDDRDDDEDSGVQFRSSKKNKYQKDVVLQIAATPTAMPLLEDPQQQESLPPQPPPAEPTTPTTTATATTQQRSPSTSTYRPLQLERSNNNNDSDNDSRNNNNAAPVSPDAVAPVSPDDATSELANGPPPPPPPSLPNQNVNGEHHHADNAMGVVVKAAERLIIEPPPLISAVAVVAARYLRSGLAKALIIAHWYVITARSLVRKLFDGRLFHQLFHQRRPRPRPRRYQTRLQLLQAQSAADPATVAMKAEFSNQYDEKDLLGEGGFGQVLQVQSRATQQLYAAKFIRGLTTADMRQMVTNEINTMNGLSDCPNPWFVRLVEAFESPLEAILVLEECRGGSLHERIQRNIVYTEAEARKVISTVLKALNYMHTVKNLAHLAIKSDNILLMDPSDDTNVKVADFGSAKFAPIPQCLQTFAGTPMILAPEIWRTSQFLGSGPCAGYGKPADMFAVGCTMYELLGGDMPFHAAVLENRRQYKPTMPTPAGRDPYKEWVGTAILNGQYDYLGDQWNGISREAKDMIDNLLEQNPDDRATPASALTADWMMTT
jgi:calcium/calmodulin-dependent protein kinase I